MYGVDLSKELRFDPLSFANGVIVHNGDRLIVIGDVP